MRLYRVRGLEFPKIRLLFRGTIKRVMALWGLYIGFALFWQPNIDPRSLGDGLA